MDIADKIIEANEKPDFEMDELGLGVANTPDYIAARALYRNTLELREDPYAGLIHNRNNGSELWKGNRQLFKSKNTIYELADLHRNLRDYEIDAVWRSLLKNTPALDESKIVIDEHTYWDIEKGELCYTKERMITI